MSEISPTRKRGIVYQFKWGESMQELAELYNLELVEVERIIREYMVANNVSNQNPTVGTRWGWK